MLEDVRVSVEEVSALFGVVEELLLVRTKQRFREAFQRAAIRLEASATHIDDDLLVSRVMFRASMWRMG